MVGELPDDLDDARDAVELRRMLVVRPGVGEVPPAVAVELFERYHGGGEPDAVDTALLLGTDWRWRPSSANVLAGILRTHILGEAEQDDLADRLLWPPRIRYVHPTGWLGSTFLEFSPSGGGAPRRVHIDPTTPMQTPRSIWPPLRRWAATRLLGRGLTQPDAVIELARSLSAQDAAAIVTGAVDAADELPEPQARHVIDVALGWGHQRRARLPSSGCAPGVRASARSTSQPAIPTPRCGAGSPTAGRSDSLRCSSDGAITRRVIRAASNVARIIVRVATCANPAGRCGPCPGWPSG